MSDWATYEYFQTLRRFDSFLTYSASRTAQETLPKVFICFWQHLIMFTNRLWLFCWISFDSGRNLCYDRSINRLFGGRLKELTRFIEDYCQLEIEYKVCIMLFFVGQLFRPASQAKRDNKGEGYLKNSHMFEMSLWLLIL